MLSSLILLALPAGAADLLHFWDEPRRGANSFNRAPPDAAYFEALARIGASWVRLTFSKAGIKVVVVPLSLPGARWRQQNVGQ